MKKIELEIVALSHSITQAQSYAVVLGEREGLRRLPIVIGAFEAQAIAVAMEKMNTARPLTHDLMKSLCEEFDIHLQEVIISNLLAGIFYAKLVCERNGEVMEIDSRTSDALALAVRFDCPIYTYEFILDAAGIILEEPGGVSARSGTAKVRQKVQQKFNDLAKHDVSKLQNLLDDAIQKEDYERAAKLRDEINRRI